ncbi:HNH endonuclease [Aeromonas allosaccharophila]|uniref:HNH endonuclease n=1 Tax=Aeromonas allosaccharophila TaxID=656 RepID=UPI002ADF5DF1|nr:HNH endonuclease signature motif containing protein [Aeromonas allosaccharophila]
MPARVPKVCRERTCHQLTTERHGYCPAHVHLLDGWKNVAKVSADDRGYDWAWRKLRKRILVRDNYLCQVCLALGIVTPATQVDHIVNKAAGGTDAESNLQGICDHCHDTKTRAEALAARQAGRQRG